MENSTLIIFGISIMTLMAMTIILFVVLYQRRLLGHQLELQKIQEQKQFELLQASLQSEEEERQRIAGELHDDVGASLASIRLFIKQAEIHPGEISILKQSGMLVDETLKKVRDISHKLQPATLQTLGLFPALQALSDLYRDSPGLNVKVSAEKEIPRLDPHTELHLYRIIQELINNAIRHSGSAAISINLASSPATLTISFNYDGNGISQDEFETFLLAKNGIGLKNISSRIRFINGTVSFEKNNTGHNLVILAVPHTSAQ